MIPPLLRRLPQFRHFWTGQTISLFGDQVTMIALPLVAVLVLDANAAQMGILTATILAPNLLFSLHFGAWIDRWGHRRQAMIAADVARAALMASIPVAYLLGVLTFTQLMIVGFLSGTFSVLFDVSYSTLFTAIVPRERYVEANQLMHGSRAFSFVTGPSVGGVLVQVLSAPMALVLDAASFLFSALFLHRITVVEPATEPAQGGQLVSGIRFIRRTRLLFASLLSTATINLFNLAFNALAILYATRELGVKPGVLGLVIGAGALGGVLGATVTGRIADRIGIGPTFILGAFLFPAPLILVPLARGSMVTILVMLFLAELGSGFGVMMLDISYGAISQSLVPDRLRARVAGSYMFINYGVRPIGSLIGGLLGAWIGVQSTLWIATLGGTLGVLFLVWSPALRLRELPEPAE
jgi:MFS family permease